MDVRTAERPTGRSVHGELTINGSSPASASPAPVPAHEVPAHDGAALAGPGGPVDLTALAEVERSLVALATSALDPTNPGRAQVELAATSALSSVATVLWFDALRAADRVSVTPNARPLVSAVHSLLVQWRTGGTSRHGGSGSGTGTGQVPSAPGPTGQHGGRGQHGEGSVARPVRAVGAGAVGPSATVWAALARRYASVRFDVAPDGRQICVLDDSELRDAAVWEAVTDERTAHLGELLWVVSVTGAAPAGDHFGAAASDRSARLFAAAGWQVLTLRHGRRLAELFRRPGGPALAQRMANTPAAEARALRSTHGVELRRRLAGSGPSGVGISRLLDTLSDDHLLACLRDLGGHDLPLLVDTFDEVDPTRPTVLFAHVDAERFDLPSRAGLPAGSGAPDPVPASEPAAAVGPPRSALAVVGGDRSRPPDLVRPGSRGAALSTRVAGWLDRPVAEPARPPAVPLEPDGDTAAAADVPTSTQAVFGVALGRLGLDAPEAGEAVVTVSTVGADQVVSAWMNAVADLSTADNRDDDDSGSSGGNGDGDGDGDGNGGNGGNGGNELAHQASMTVELAGQVAGRHVAGALSPGAFGGVLSSLARAWSRLGLALFPVGVADEAAAAAIGSEWARAADSDARSLLVVADTTYPAGPGQARWTAPASTSGAIYWQPAFAQDVEWVTRAALGGLATEGGLSHVLRLSARVVDQRLAALPAGVADRRLRRAQVLAGAYPLRDGGPFGALTLVGLGAVMPEVLRAAEELTSVLGRRIGVVCVTSPDLLFRAVQARRGLARGSSAVLDAAFPSDRRTPLVTVTDGDPQTLAFLAGMRGDPIATLGSTAPDPSGGDGVGCRGHAQGTAEPPAPVHLATIVGAALDLLGV